MLESLRHYPDWVVILGGFATALVALFVLYVILHWVVDALKSLFTLLLEKEEGETSPSFRTMGKAKTVSIPKQKRPTRQTRNVEAVIAAARSPTKSTTILSLPEAIASPPKTSPYSWDKVVTLLRNEIRKIIEEREKGLFSEMGPGKLTLTDGKSKNASEAVLVLTGAKNGFEIEIRIADKIFLPSSRLPSFRKGHPLEKWSEVPAEIEKLISSSGTA